MPNTNKLTVLILAAGYGRRMGQFSRMVPKALVPYNNKPLISHIMEKFDISTRFVIACGHMGQHVKDYVSVVHQDKDIVFVDITTMQKVTPDQQQQSKCARSISTVGSCG